MKEFNFCRIWHFVKPLKMEGTVRFLLITILATAATANYEYNREYVTKIYEYICQLDAFQFNLHNVNALVEWTVVVDPSSSDIIFEVKDPLKSSGKNCGEGPALILDRGPKHCLFQMRFIRGIVANQEALQLFLSFRNENDSEDGRVIITEVFKKSPNEFEEYTAVDEVEPITRAQLVNARSSKSFQGPATWLNTMLRAGIYNGNPYRSLTAEGSGDSEEKHIIVYVACPIIMDAATLNDILELPSKLQSSRKQRR